MYTYINWYYKSVALYYKCVPMYGLIGIITVYDLPKISGLRHLVLVYACLSKQQV